jgi:hypothetical protein
VRLTLAGDQPGAAAGGESCQQRGLAAGSGAQVEPGRIVASDGSRRQRHRDQLRALVLDAGAALGDGRDRARVAALEDHAVRRPRRRFSRELVAGGPSGSSHERDPGRLVVGGQQLVQLGPAERVAQLLDHPLRVAVGDRRVPHGRRHRIGGDAGDPLVEVVRGDLAQDGVREAGGPRADPGPDQVHGRADRGVGRHSHRQQLVDTEPQRVEDLGLHLAERSVHAGGEDRVVRPASADRPRHQLGDERGVPAGEPVVAQHDRQHEVGVRVVDADGLEHVHGGGAGRVRRRSRGR